MTPKLAPAPRDLGPWTYTMRLATILTLNDRRHWRTTAPIKKHIRGLSKAHAFTLRIPRQEFIIIGTLFHPPTLRYRDADNAMATVKPIIDGIQDAGIVLDDDARHVTFAAPLFGKPTSYPWWSVKVTISTREPVDYAAYIEPPPPRVRVPRGPAAQCGDPGGASRHRRAGERPCAECRAADTARKKAARAAKARP